MAKNGKKGTAEYWIERLGLEAHPEGGYFRQTYRAELTIAREALPAGFEGARAASTAIYFLLEGENFSAFHRLRSDEVWHFYAGAPVAVHVIDEGGRYGKLAWGAMRRREKFFRRWWRRGAGSRRRCATGSRGRWWGARWLRDLTLRTLRWPSGRS